ncbi:hypothetical protein [Thiohalomonas denitrificans]|uniref:General secretion pathway protein G n=1 Tax=Thiohalomonas denitrificans TaxID=415747 RepID=A0A1G5QTY5_9GAMM|nr:hypothetical protein [Thiohalomonas denitrificans]SCZ65136.1 hypothetical protein SAMN03097708_02791 [Thiohalomonas denitrificans]
MTILIAIFITLVIDRVWALRIVAEQTGVEHTIGTLKSALGLEVVARVIQDKGLSELAELDGSNPIALLEQPPGNYLGELDAPDPAGVKGNRWYFDRSRKLLIYRVAYSDYLKSPLSGPARIRFMVRVDYRRDNSGDRSLSPQAGRIRGIDLVPVERYQWVEE